MPTIDFGPWLPDQAKIGPPHLVVASGVLPGVDHYRPLPGLTATTAALTARARGLYAARDINASAHMYAADATKLYELELATGWTDRSKAGGYTAASNTRWRWATFGDRLIPTNGLEPVQFIDMSTAATQFADLAGAPGIARFVAAYGEFVFLGALGANKMMIKWSAIGSSIGWTAGVNQSDEQEFADGGEITGLIATRSALYVFQEHCVRRVIYTGGDVIMRIDKLIDGIGNAEPNSLVAYGQQCFFLGDDGWYGWDFESQPTPIGLEKFDRWFLGDSSRAYWYSMSTTIDPKNRLFAAAYSTGGSDVPDSILFYNYALDRATYARLPVELLAVSVAASTSIDDLTLSIDTGYAISFDDPFWQGGTFYFGAMDTLHQLASFSGANVAATLETSQAPLAEGARARAEWIKPIIDTSAASVAGGAAVRAGDAISYSAAVAQQNSGRCPMRGVNGFFMSAKLTVPAATTWTYARGIEFAAGYGGVR